MTVTTPRGFRAAGVAAGLKSTGALDLALVVNDGPAHAAAGVFTRNKVKAAPVLWSQQVLTTGRLRAVVLNSGGANACTGPEGFQTAHATAEKAAEVLGCAPLEVAVCSTGLIGKQLPREAVLAGVEAAAAALGDDAASALAAATAIMTTDTVAKQAAHTDDTGWSIGGTTKGAGMIAPSMATMLTVLTTDAVVDAPVLDEALRAAVRVSFDRLDVDGSHVHERHRARARLGCLRRGRGPGRVHHRADGRLPRPRPADAGRRRGRHQADHGAGHRRRHRGRRGDGRAHDRPRQPGEDRDLRVGRQLGPHRGRGGVRGRGRRPGPARHHRQRRPAVPGRGGRGRPHATPTCRARRCSSRSPSGSAAARRTSSRRTCRTPTWRRTVPTPPDAHARTPRSPTPARRRPCSPRRCPGCSGSTGGSSWSSTAATR